MPSLHINPIKVIILGAGGNSIAIVDAIHAINAKSPDSPRYTVLGFLDDLQHNLGTIVAGYPVLGTIEEAKNWTDCKFINGIASTSSFRKKNDVIKRSGIDADGFVTIIHPNAIVSPDVIIGHGCAIMANSVLCPQTNLGNHVIVLQNTTINHHSSIGDFATLSAGITVLGYVVIGDGAFVGGGATIAPHLYIGNSSLIGMASVVIRDVASGSVVAGNPARTLPKSRYSIIFGNN